MKKLVAGLLIAGMLMALPTGCKKNVETPASQEPAVSAMGGAVKRENGKQALFELKNLQSGKKAMSDEELKKAYSQFVFGVMKNCAGLAQNKNMMISADSILFALEMAACGADGETLAQMTQTMVPGADNYEALRFAVERMNRLKNDSLKIANSVWINESKTARVYQDYLEYIEKNFDAGSKAVAFGPEGVSAINKWVAEKTNGRISDLLDELSPDDLMVLVNAVSFDGKWKNGYSDDDVWTQVFTGGDGQKREVMFIHGKESVYLQNEKATGFLKDYDDGKYAFLTILPNDTAMDINEFIANMTPEEYWTLWESRSEEFEVTTSMPEFKSEYDVQLAKILYDMGMEDAFDERKADFSNMATSQPCISKVIHKTFIDVNRNGTSAAAATAVVMTDECVREEPDNVKKVICDRPFAYAVVDKETGLPVFLGTVENV